MPSHSFQAELALDCQNLHGEGLFWSAEQQLLYWTDIAGMQLWRFDPVTEQVETFDMPERLCAFALRENGSLLAGFASGVAIYYLESGERKAVCDFEPDNPHTRLNDGRCDRQGRFIVGGIDESGSSGNRKATSSVIQVSPDLSVNTLISGVACANSTAFSPDGKTLYFTDTPTNRIQAFGYQPQTGQLGAVQRVIEAGQQPGVPDGSTVDSEGCLWNARYNGYSVTRYTPDGQIERIIRLPVPHATCVAIGGPQLDTLYITTLKASLTEEQLQQAPLSGGLFAIRLKDAGLAGVTGVAEPQFAG